MAAGDTDLLDPVRLQRRLDELCRAHRVPGACLAVLAGGEVVEAAAGTVNVRTGVPVTTDTVFQIGSVTKVWTATVVMALVERGLLDLDAPVRTYLPDFRVADAEATEKATLRHFLTHTSGIDGDNFAELGRGDDVLERYVATCADLGQVHPLGASLSYCNTGYSLAGRVIEVVTGTLWDRAMRHALFEPLGLARAGTLPEEAIMWRAAVGHVGEGGGDLHPAAFWQLPRTCGPAGLVHATAAELLAFARLHLDEGTAVDGTRLLRPETVRAMQEEQVRVPDPYTVGQAWGLGWILFEWGGGRRVIGHDGNTVGQSAFLRLVPEAGVAVALVAASNTAHPVYRALFGELLEGLAGVRMPPDVELPSTPAGVDPAPYAGTYERLGVRVVLQPDGHDLHGTVVHRGPLEGINADYDFRLVAVDRTLWLAVHEGVERPAPVVFLDLEDGVPQAFHTGLRRLSRTRV